MNNKLVEEAEALIRFWETRVEHITSDQQLFDGFTEHIRRLKACLLSD